MGIMKSIRKNRTKAKAEIKAAKARARQAVKEDAKLELRREKLLAKAEKDLLKREARGLKDRRKHERKMAENTLAQIKQGRINSANVRRWAGAARLALPLLLPLIYRAITAGREQVAEAKARKVGVSVDQLARFAGHGSELKARTHGVRQTLSEEQHSAGFVRDVKDRLDELDKAIDNAEFMTPEQRRRAHNTISRDIDAVTQEIQDRLRRP
ncbi:hypothetical protein HCH15_12135 [Corynebacterium testudinoris]|uniref:DUF6474 family protein n=1 Tax=Corynebacterium testudinoris TaxID=136857 RepID=UPI001C8C97F6|nr:DUF6474 family protein [Corynebacterium testudinoris]MBX8996920.1 hypothetical protein [Corynebacterium testudinoris]